MTKHLFKTTGIYARNILPDSIKKYYPLLDKNKYWDATNYKNNISSYEILTIDFHQGSRLRPPHLKARFDTKTGEIFSIADHYNKNFSVYGSYDVNYNDDYFWFGNDEFTVYGSPIGSDNANNLDSLHISIKKTNTDLYVETEGVYQNEMLRFISFLR